MSARRTDANHALIVETFRACGWQVVNLSMVGHGCADLFVSPPDACFGLLVEIKSSPQASFTPAELRFYQVFPGLVHVVASVEDVQELVERWSK